MRSAGYSRTIILLAVLFIGSIIEGASYVAGRYLRNHGVFYSPFVSPQYETYLNERDQILGWPKPQSIPSERFDPIGSRPIPAYPDVDSPACVSIYGDSFIWGDGVDDEHSIPNLLSQALSCRVNNFGVPGYGSDQALLRLERTTKDTAPIRILSHLSENILRNVNQFRDFIYPSSRLGFKPRFTLDDTNELRLVPLQRLTLEEYTRAMRTPHEQFPNDYFEPGGPSGISPLSFPFTLSVLTAFDNYRVRALLAGEPRYLAFYSADHESQALQITTKIFQRFVDGEMAKGRTPIALLLPTARDLQWSLSKKHRPAPYDPLHREISRFLPKAQLIDPSQAFFNAVAPAENDQICTLFAHCHGHYNEKGNAVVVEQLAKAIKPLLKEL